MSIKANIQEVYLDWVNNFLTIEKFAEYYGLDRFEAALLVKLGEAIHERIVRETKELAA